MNENECKLKINFIKKARKEQGFTQKQIVEKLNKKNISFSIDQYKRLENNNIKNVKKILPVIQELEKILNISEEKNKKINKELHIRIPVLYMKQVEELQRAKGFISQTETLIFILKEYFENISIFSAKYELNENMERVLVHTFVREMKKMRNDLDEYETLLKVVTDLSDDKIKQIKEEIRNQKYKNIHAKQY